MTRQRWTASAPGKLMLSGEYAVLDGAPAICMAIDRRAVASVVEIGGTESTVAAPGFSTAAGRFETTPDGIEWRAGGDRFTLVDAVWRAAGKRTAAAIDLNTSEFLDAGFGSKIGIGSSAALTVALCAACRKTDNVAGLAHRVHSRWQQGAGSGADIACSVTGGLIKYRSNGTRATPLDWPKELRFRVIWTGVAASTREKLAKLDVSKRLPSRVRLAAAAEVLASAWSEGDTAGIVSGSKQYVEHLRDFDADYGLDVFAAGHADLCDLATAENLVYKPCGAGGGDIGVVLGGDVAALDAFTASLPAKFSVIQCALDCDGVRLEEK